MLSRTHFEHFNGDGYSGFLENVSITFIDKTDPRTLKKEKIIGSKLLKPWYLGV